MSSVSIADATLASPQHGRGPVRAGLPLVSIADATLASPQRANTSAMRASRLTFQSQTRRLLPRNFTGNAFLALRFGCFNRRRDACFPATAGRAPCNIWLRYEFQSQTRRLLPRNGMFAEYTPGKNGVSIADATLASPQPIRTGSLQTPSMD